MQGLLALGKALVHAAVQIDLPEQYPEPRGLQNRVATGKSHEREGPSDDHAEDEREERAVASTAADAAFCLQFVLEELLLYAILVPAVPMRPVGTDAAIVSHTGRGIPGVSGAAVTTLKKSSTSAVPFGFTSA